MPRDGRSSSQHDDTKKGKKKMLVVLVKKERWDRQQTTSVDIDISYRVTLFDFYLHTNKTLI